MILKENADLVINTALKACDAIMHVYHSEKFDLELKGDYSPLTRADKKAHQIISDGLSKTNLPILSEEGSQIPFSIRSGWSQFWLVDPLDGTKEFLKKNGEFTVNIALVNNRIPVFGVIAIPVDRKVYYGPLDGKVFCRESGGRLSILKRRTSIDGNDSGVRVVASRSHLDPQTSKMIAQFKNPDLITKGSSLKFILLAEDLADIYPRFAPTMEWDTAAADAILRALNIHILDVDHGLPLNYNKEDLRNPFFICKPG